MIDLVLLLFFLHFNTWLFLVLTNLIFYRLGAIFSLSFLLLLLLLYF